LGLDATLAKKLLTRHTAKSRRRTFTVGAFKMKLMPPKENNKEEKEAPGASPEDESALFGITDACYGN